MYTDTINSIKNRIMNKIKIPYHNVPPCPKCGSFVTGEFIKMKWNDDKKWLVNDSLKRGEIINPVVEMTENNCFCVECGYAWNENINVENYSLAQIEEEKKKRHTATFLADNLQYIKEHRKKGLSGLFINFIGKW